MVKDTRKRGKRRKVQQSTDHKAEWIVIVA